MDDLRRLMACARAGVDGAGSSGEIAARVLVCEVVQHVPVLDQGLVEDLIAWIRWTSFHPSEARDQLVANRILADDVGAIIV